MTHLFDVWEEVSQSLKASHLYYLGFDFDGTLSPIVADPEEAQIQPGVGRLLRDLSFFENVIIAIFSGRSLEDIRGRVAIEGIAYSGEHGLAIQLPGGQVFEKNPFDGSTGIHQQIERIKALTSMMAGVMLEPKESSITVHYRQAAKGVGEELKPILEKLVEGSAFHLQPGRMCWEINPKTHWNKGDAYNWVKDHSIPEDSHCFEMYVGDDRTDEDVFEVIPAEGFPVWVRSSEREKSAHARYHLDSQSEVVELLQKFKETLTDTQSP
jgi:trehalose 6-phosphate phosphatase